MEIVIKGTPEEIMRLMDTQYNVQKLISKYSELREDIYKLEKRLDHMRPTQPGGVRIDGERKF